MREPMPTGGTPARRSAGAPGKLEALRSFVNTRDVDRGTDLLGRPGDLRAWLAAHPSLPQPGRVTVDELRAALRMREALRAALCSHVGHPGQGTDPGADPFAELREVARTLNARFDVTSDGMVVTAPTGGGIARSLAAMLAIAADAGAAGTWSRLKACSAESCHWIFYDRSPTHNARWCSMRECGARAKSRRYRQRAKAARTG
jgi:predicted RNA-binding Zn ribbon-like protein